MRHKKESNDRNGLQKSGTHPQDYADRVDGMYLFANDDVLNFYPKFGFQKATEYQYSKEVKMDTPPTMKHISMSQKKEWDQLKTVIDRSICRFQRLHMHDC